MRGDFDSAVELRMEESAPGTTKKLVNLVVLKFGNFDDLILSWPEGYSVNVIVDSLLNDEGATPPGCELVVAFKYEPCKFLSWKFLAYMKSVSAFFLTCNGIDFICLYRVAQKL